MQVTVNNDVKVYNLSAGKSLPQWIEDAKKNQKSLRYDEDFRRRIDLIQDFEFNVASSRVRVSPDGEFIAATGVYPPEMRLFETRELGMKCHRGLDHEVVDFLFLSDDYKKLAFLQDDRTLEFHAQYGRHHKVRVPKAGRSLCYDQDSCVIFVGGSSSEVVRLDLEAGTWQAPVATSKMEEVNQVVVNPVLPVISCAGDGGMVESFDLRESTRPLQSLQVCRASDGTEGDQQVTCCAYSASGMQFAAGTSDGIVRIYDLRSSRPVSERDHMNGYGIRSVSFLVNSSEEERQLVGSADTKAIKVWDAATGAMKASVENGSTINDVTFVPSSGLILVANDAPRVGVYFIPSLGLAPRWCTFLDSMTEELEESKQKSVYDDYQFVTNDELESLGATELIGTKFLQPYMHGFFMDQRLHGRLKAAMEPFAFEEYRKQKVKEKLESKRTMRARVRKSKDVDVNTDLHKKLQDAAEEGAVEGASKKRKEAATRASTLLADDRFKVLFDDPDFAISEKGIAGELEASGAASAKSLAELTAGSSRGKKRRNFNKNT
eukprot:TRINITY_DN55854_c0_g1_i1.p1 TRINITY_DN55854_c0_g1~~TRINITY_DN55854_c0_g1_i1.p1  ORF type:complete len:575 (+),score=134.67 TRINITY_DN55854_c0_g1_i1:82-1725(+)